MLASEARFVGSIPAGAAYCRLGINKYMTYYILYQVTNNLNSKIYVGVHKTQDLNDGYMGSGKVINSAIKKHGIENFTRVILEQFDDSAAMYAREKEIVNDDFLNRADTYNLRRGGKGGFDYINQFSELQNNRTLDGSKRGGLQALAMGVGIHNPQQRVAQANEQKIRKYGFCDPAFRKKGQDAARTECSILKRKETFATICHQQGSNNSQFGKMWITNEQESKKILKTDVIPEGWRVGRVIK